MPNCVPEPNPPAWFTENPIFTSLPVLPNEEKLTLPPFRDQDTEPLEKDAPAGGCMVRVEPFEVGTYPDGPGERPLIALSGSGPAINSELGATVSKFKV